MSSMLSPLDEWDPWAHPAQPASHSNDLGCACLRGEEEESDPCLHTFTAWVSPHGCSLYLWG